MIFLFAQISFFFSVVASAQDVTPKFEMEPKSTLLKLGSQFIIPCQVDLKADKCSWFKDGKEFNTNEDLSFTTSSNNGTCDLTIKKFVEKNNGDYQCKVQVDKTLLNSTIATIKAVVFQKGSQPENKEVKFGDPVTIPCWISESALKCDWFKDDKQLKRNTQGYTFEEDSKTGNCNLTISTFTIEHNGNYTCNVTVEVDTLVLESNTALVKGKVEFESQSQDLLVKSGGALTIPCKINVKSEKCEWYKDDIVLPPNAGNNYSYAVTDPDGDCKLKFPKFTKEFNGNYKCHVTVGTETFKSNSTTASVFDFKVQPQFMEVKFGQAVTIPCQINTAAVKCVWEKEGAELKQNPPNVIFPAADTKGVCDLNISSFSVDDIGSYQCTVTTSAVDLNSDSAIVTASLNFESQPSDQLVKFGRKVIVPCRIDTAAEQCIWYKDNKILKASKDYSFLQNLADGMCELEIHSFTSNLTGDYKCSVKVKFFVHSKAGKLTGENISFEKHPRDEFVKKNEKFVLPCVVDTVPDECVWIKDGYELENSNDYSLSTNLGKGDCSLTITKFNPSTQSGLYACIVKSGLINVYSRQGIIRELKDEPKVKFMKEPVSSSVRYDVTSTIINCEINAPADDCKWMKNGRHLNLVPKKHTVDEKKKANGVCSLKISKFKMEDDGFYVCQVTSGDEVILSKGAELKVNVSFSSGPSVQVNDFKSYSSDLYVLFDPTKTSQITVGCSTEKVFPVSENGTEITFFVDGVKQEIKQTTKASTAGPGTFDVSGILSLTLTESALFLKQVILVSNVTCVFKDTTREKSVSRIFVTPNSTIPAKQSKVSLNIPSDERSLAVEPYLGSSVAYEWFEKKPDGNWTNLNKNDATYRVSSLAQQGNKTFRAKIRQNDMFDVPVFSEEMTVLSYNPLTEVNIVSPLDVTLKQGESDTLRCIANGDPKPKIVWLKLSGDLLLEDSIGENKTVSQSGLYKCGASQTVFGKVNIIGAYGAVRVTVE